jgi:hypothetical protein
MVLNGKNGMLWNRASRARAETIRKQNRATAESLLCLMTDFEVVKLQYPHRPYTVCFYFRRSRTWQVSEGKQAGEQ